MNILIAEDDILIAEHLKDIVLSFNYNVIGIAHKKDKVIELIEKNVPDVALLDINMENKYDGIEIGEYIQKNYNFPIIYITAHSEKETIEKALKTKPSGYIVKPFKDMEIFSSIQIAFDKFRSNKSDNYILIKDGYKVAKLYVFDILFVKSDNNYVEIFTKDNKYIERISLASIIESIDSDNFVKVHRSYIINTDYVREIKSLSVIVGDYEIPVARKYRKELKSICL